MNFRVATAAAGVLTSALVLLSPTAAQAAAKPYDHQDPYRSGCGNSARVVKTAAITSRANGRVGTVKLMWSGRCQTNWIEINTVTSGSGQISLHTADGRSDTFRYRAGNRGRHWGDMLWAKDMCAWGSATVQWNGGRGGQNGYGTTPKACR